MSNCEIMSEKVQPQEISMPQQGRQWKKMKRENHVLGLIMLNYLKLMLLLEIMLLPGEIDLNKCLGSLMCFVNILVCLFRYLEFLKSRAYIDCLS